VTTRSYDVLVIGAGHNGLVAAAYLAKAGLRTLIVERGEAGGGALAGGQMGGAQIPSVAHTVGRLSRAVVDDLKLHDHGFVPITPEVRAWAPHPDGTSLTLYADTARTASELQRLSQHDAASYLQFDVLIRSLAGFVAKLDATIPPGIDKLAIDGALAAARLARSFRGLSKHDARALMRVLPMAVADFVAEHFDHEFLRGVLAARGVQYTSMGPWSPGTTSVLLGDSAGNDGGAPGQTVYARGGPAALAEALVTSARSLGAGLRTDSEVAQVRTDADARVEGVTLTTGEEIDASTVVSGTDPKRVLCDLLDPVVVGPQLRWRASNIRMPGTVAKVNLVLNALPRWAALDDGVERLQGRIVIAPSIDYLERAHDDAKYGRVAGAPLLEATMPTLTDPTIAPDGTHVMSILVNYAPYHRRDGDWNADRDNFGDLILKSLDEYAPGIGDLVTEREVLTPLDLQTGYGLTEGHPMHGEPGLDQMFAWRPLWGLSRYRLGVDGLYLCGSGAHPGGGITGKPGRNAAGAILKDLRKQR
jgi:phytoene dehydrogenase-like protein